MLSDSPHTQKLYFISYQLCLQTNFFTSDSSGH